jgi:Glutamate synthase domain 1
MSKLISKNDFRDNCGFGLIADINGIKSHKIITKSINALKSMTHRGAIGADGKTGDGCGILIDLDKDFFIDILNEEQNIKITDEFAIGQIFTKKRIQKVLPKINKILEEENLILKAIRNVPIDKKILGDIALEYVPKIYQLFIQSSDNTF